MSVAAPHVNPSDDQWAAIKAAVAWYKMDPAVRPQVFRLFGPAGSGKTSIIPNIISEIGLSDMVTDEEGESSGDVIYATLSGKAADVMRSKGLPARTIHSTIYEINPDDKAAIAECRNKLRKTKKEMSETTNVDKIDMLNREMLARREELTKLTDPRFNPCGSDVVRRAKLFALDEVSQVGGQIKADLLSHGVPCLVSGDPFQLPPIEKDGAAFTEAPADYLLTQIHRQAADNPIIALSKTIREGGFIKFGDIGGKVFVTGEKPTPDQMSWADQVIVGKNVTRYELNNAMKNARGFVEDFPMGRGEKLICVRNNKDAKLFNGQAVSFQNVATDGPYLYGQITAEGREPKKDQPFVSVYRGHFENTRAFDPDRLRNDYFNRLNSVELDWSYAVTAHKGQGSEWPNVMVVNDGWGQSSEEKRRWLYTAVTRARENLGIIMGWVGR